MREAAPILIAMAAVLAVIVFVTPRFGRCDSRVVRNVAAQAQVANFGIALRTFRDDNGYYPIGTNGLLELLQKPLGATNWQGPYLQAEAIPLDPWGQGYIYQCPGKHNAGSYDLSSKGPQGEGILIANWVEQKK